MDRSARGGFSAITINGVTLEYRLIEGAPDRPTFVLLHEGLGCCALWRDFPDRLAEASACRVFAYSRAGYGDSDAVALPRPLDYMSREAIDVLPHVIAGAGIGEHIVIGHSDGASIALVYAGTAPPDLRAAVVIAPHVFTEPISVEAIRRANAAYTDGPLRERLAKYHGENVDVAFRGWCDSWLHPDFRSWSIEPALPGISVPVLQIQGSDDEYGTAEQLRRIERGSSGTVETLLLEDCGHAPQFDQAGQTLEAILAFTRG